ncbi:MAG: hypothetical protein HOA01_06110 [Flavobacteriales bacterium]|nr:hypothetical protein [Flavobacteriales bacterium]
MKKKIIGVVAIIVLLGGGIGLYMLNMPHRDALNIEAEFNLTASELANQFLENNKLANSTYLSEDGDSKVGIVKGKVIEVGKNAKGDSYVIIRDDKSFVGAQCSFQGKINVHISDNISVKGVIRSGAEYDEDFEEYIDVIMEQCYLINNN